MISGLTLTAIVTTTAALVAVYIAWQQWRTARHKLAVDLFDRRLQTYRALNEAITTRHNEVLALTFEQVTSNPPTQALAAFWAAKSDAYFLFGRDVQKAIDWTEEKLRILLDEKSEFTTDPDRKMPDYVKVIRASANVFGAQDRLLEAVKPYMMLGMIGAARPRLWRRREPLGSGAEHAGPDRTNELVTSLAEAAGPIDRSNPE